MKEFLSRQIRTPDGAADEPREAEARVSEPQASSGCQAAAP
jgi:hypothetical protein